MKTIDNSNLISSQKSPDVFCIPPYEINGMHVKMFLEDFCRDFSFDMKASDLDHDFYYVIPSEDKLNSLLKFINPYSFKRNFDKLLSRILESLILSGKSYVEIVTWENSGKEIQGISFVPLSPVKVFRVLGKSYFIVKKFDGSLSKFSIESKHLIRFSLKDIGFSTSQFKKLIKDLKTLDLIDTSGMIENCEKNGFDFNEYTQARAFKLLSTTKKVYWYGRDSSNQFFSESYLLYRNAKFKELRKNIYMSIISKINMALQPYQGCLGFSGEICVHAEWVDYEAAFEKLKRGEINTSQLSKLVFRL